MGSFLDRALNTVCHVIVDGKANESFYLAIHLLMVLQTIACIAHPQSLLFAAVQWADPSNYLPPAFPILLCALIVFALTLLLALKLLITESSRHLLSPNIFKIYLGNLMLYLQMICKTSVLAPLVRATLCELKAPSLSATGVVGIVSLSLYLGLILPLSLYTTSNTFILTPQLNKKLTYINVYFLLNLFRVPIAIFACESEGALLATTTIFFLVFLLMSLKQPVFAYSHERLLKGMVSAVAFACLARLGQIGEERGSILLELVGTASFIALVDWVAQVRIRKILELPRPTIHQIKLLIFLVYNIEQHFEKLQYFILRHHRRCSNPQCQCSRVVQAMTGEGEVEREYSDTLWYRFLIGVIEGEYCLREMERLGESEMKERIGKYQYVVIDLAEMYALKLGLVNQAYYIVNTYRHLLRSKGISFLSFRQKERIINYYLQETINLKYRAEGVVNLNAHAYMGFQLAYETYKRTLVKTTHSTAELWQEMAKREPDADRIVHLVRLLERQNNKVRSAYKEIVSTFQNSGGIVREMTNEYFLRVLNIQPKSPLHVIETAKYGGQGGQGGKEKVEKISEDMQAFSLDSDTPMCFVAVDEDTFGQVTFCNSHFNRVMGVEFGAPARVEEFLVPEMRAGHEAKMREFIRGDNFNAEHSRGFILNRQGKIVYARILVQIIPSIAEGLRYSFYLRKLMPQRKVVGLKNNSTIAYTSESFDEAFSSQERKRLVVSMAGEEERIRALGDKDEIKLMVNEEEVGLRFLYRFTEGEADWLFVEVLEEGEPMADTNLRTQAKMNQTRRTNALLAKDSVLSREEDSEARSGYEKSDLQEKLAMEKMRKMEEALASLYRLVVEGRTSIARKMVAFTVVVAVVLVGLLTAVALVKVGNRGVYGSTVGSNQAFSRFMMTVSGAVYSAKMLNFYQYTGNATLASLFYSLLSSYSSSNITNAMGNMVLNYDIAALTQTWTTISCNASSGVFALGTQNNFLTVSDYLQSPVTNLAASAASSFKFPPNLKGQVLPLGSAQCLYFEIILNSLYVTIPKFIALKKSVMDKILLGRIDTVIPMNILLIVVLLLALGYVLGKVLLNMRVWQVKNQAYDLLESVDREVLEGKAKQCKQFLLKYAYLTPPQESKELAEEDFQPNISTINSKNMSKTMEEQTERELDLNSAIAAKAGKKEGGKKIKGKAVFARGSRAWIFWKFTLLASPILIFALLSATLEALLMHKTVEVVTIQQKIQTLQLNVNLVLLYGMQHGSEGSQFGEQLNVQTYLPALMSEIFEIQRTLLSNDMDMSYLPKLREFFAATLYGDLCALPAFAFRDTLQAGCATISKGILTKGLYSALVSYLTEMKTLLNGNPDTTAYNSSQRMAYLSSPFFTTNGNLSQYFNDLFAQFLLLFSHDFSSFAQRSTDILVFSILALILLMALGGTLLEARYMSHVSQQMLEVRSLLVLISYQTIIGHQSLRQRFSDKSEQFKKLK